MLVCDWPWAALHAAMAWLCVPEVYSLAFDSRVWPSFAGICLMPKTIVPVQRHRRAFDI